MEDMLKNLLGMTDKINDSVKMLKQMKEEQLKSLSDEEKKYVNNVEKIAKKFSDSDDISGLMNYLNSVQEKIIKNASTDRD
jgi:flagellar biosynthesis chaperone FliJ